MRVIYPCGEAKSNHLVCQIYHRYHASLSFYALGLCKQYQLDFSLADDLMQDFYLKVLMHTELVQKALDKKGTSYLKRMLRYLCIDKIRKQISISRLKNVLEHKSVSSVQFEELNAAGSVESIEPLLSKPDFFLMKRYLSGYSYKEIAAELGETVSALCVRVHRLKKVLRKHLRR